MKKILIGFAAALPLFAAACGKSAKVSVCEKTAECTGVGDKAACSRTEAADAGAATSRCVAESDANDACLDAKGVCAAKTYSAGTACNNEAAALSKCHAAGG